jgi:hypothetical protein
MADRYGASIAAAPTGASSYGAPVATSPTAAPAATADRYGILPVTGAAPDTSAYPSNTPAAATGVAQAPSRYDMTPPAAPEAATQNPGTQVANAAGQYRPGGTSNYEGPGSHIEVATRPTAPSTPASSAGGATTTAPVTYPGMPTGQQPY